MIGEELQIAVNITTVTRHMEILQELLSRDNHAIHCMVPKWDTRRARSDAVNITDVETAGLSGAVEEKNMRAFRTDFTSLIHR